MALKAFFVLLALAAVLIGFALPTPGTRAKAPEPIPQIATLDIS
ncbi:MAG: hypothetical protein Q7V15_00845 [Phenylobacterium sp.]|nr:hypothetical protein [Phenylobacterium sp.]MDO8899883.1 hypothetical protein [Phenylobacterium sp.]MDP2214032.1 hypothetical protein [Phenylobacterium sp.]